MRWQSKWPLLELICKRMRLVLEQGWELGEDRRHGRWFPQPSPRLPCETLDNSCIGKPEATTSTRDFWRKRGEQCFLGHEVTEKIIDYGRGGHILALRGPYSSAAPPGLVALVGMAAVRAGRPLPWLHRQWMSPIRRGWWHHMERWVILRL